MAQPNARADGAKAPQSEILIFTIDDHRYGLSTSCVQELVRVVRSVSVPNAPDRIEGVIDLHGQIVPVLDMRRSLGLAPKVPQSTEHLIIVRIETRLIAIRADRATDVRQVEPEMVHDMLGAFDGAEIIRMQDGLVTMLDTVLTVPSSKGEGLDAGVRGGK
jgi:purine-binding chemotaxis protein CheW